MIFFVHLAILPVVTNFVSCELSVTKPPHADGELKITAGVPSKSTSEMLTPSTQRSVWLYPSSSYHPGPSEDNIRYRGILRQPHGVTKLVKALSLGFDPYFSKDYFEPFERRPRPVTLIEFRKRGVLRRYPPREYRNPESNLEEVAELQSPFNEISSFWRED